MSCMAPMIPNLRAKGNRIHPHSPCGTAERGRILSPMSENRKLDFMYAVANTELVLVPQKHLETFGNTLVDYHLVSEGMDSVGQIKVRRGRMQINRPQIVTPDAYARIVLDGFGEEASKYAEWLREHDSDFHILRYGYALRKEAFSEETITDTLEAVVERVKSDVEASKNPFGAVLKGVDEPWDVCLLRLFVAVVQGSIRSNVMEMAQRHLFEMEDGIPRPIRDEIERAFRAAAADPSLVKPLGSLLRKHNLFDRYEERFFALVRNSIGK